MKRNATNQLSAIAVTRAVVVPLLLLVIRPAPAQAVESLPDGIGTGQGICVLAGVNRHQQAMELAGQSELTVYLQSPDADDVRLGRQRVSAAGWLGTRIYVEHGVVERIHLADNLADVLVAPPSSSSAELLKQQRAEWMRVLRPGGVLIEGRVRTAKPVPRGSGQWTHPYHGADNNPQSEDTLARAPYVTQFLGTPWYGPMPQVTLSAGGRLFKAFGHLAFKQREWPLLGKLICLNGYNGSQLWQRDLAPGFMIHRNTLVATPEILYVGDNESCKLIDTASGKLLDEIVVPEDLADGPAWKWMTVRDGILYALVGEREKLHAVQRGTRTATGWPWTTVRQTYGPFQDSWGYGRTLLAMDLESRRVLWSHREAERIDGRAVCMNDERIFAYSHAAFLAAVDIADGQVAWRTSDPRLLAAIGDHERAQDPRLGYATSAYLKCSNEALFFAGPQRRKLVAVAARDGRLLWTYDDGNQQLVLRDDGLYAMGRLTNSKKFDPLSGKVLADLHCFRGNCTRATGTADSIFARGYRHSGTLRFDLGTDLPRRLPAIGPACQDGVVVANGLLYWGPWMCDCNHSLVGVISLGAAGDLVFDDPPTDRDRLQVDAPDLRRVAQFAVDERDWPTYRANNQRSAASPASVPGDVRLAWTATLTGRRPADSDGDTAGGVTPTAPVSAGGLVFVGGSDGAVTALDAAAGDDALEDITGGTIFYPPSLWNGRLYVGSADGWVYALEAATGRQLWRFRAAPQDRKIPVYGRLSSTWPVASGVLVEHGVAYAAAGIASHDGTHVLALDAISGKLRWHNGSSGNLTGPHDVIGVSVQGHLLWHDGKLYLAGGNVVSPAIYDGDDGRCLNVLTEQPDQTRDDHWQMQRSSRGSQLYLAEGRVVAAGRMLYSPAAEGPPSRYLANYVLQAAGRETVIQGNDQVVMRIDPRRTVNGKARLLWQDRRLTRTAGIALAANAVIVAGRRAAAEDEPDRPALMALDPESGQVMWSHALPASAQTWGLAIDRDGRVLVSLRDGRVLCFAGN